jgi:hypothetical protein
MAKLSIIDSRFTGNPETFSYFRCKSDLLLRSESGLVKLSLLWPGEDQQTTYQANNMITKSRYMSSLIHSAQVICFRSSRNIRFLPRIPNVHLRFKPRTRRKELHPSINRDERANSECPAHIFKPQTC